MPLESFGVFAQGDLLTRVAMERMLAGIATRSFERASEPVAMRNILVDSPRFRLFVQSLDEREES